MNVTTCDIALTITLKVLQHNPSLAASVLQSYLKCFQLEVASGNSTQIANIALGYLPELVMLAQGKHSIVCFVVSNMFSFPEYRYILLKLAFEMALVGNQCALPQLVMAFKSISTQIGC